MIQLLHTKGPNAQRGATLVEFMVAMTVGLFLVLAASSAFLMLSRNFDSQRGQMEARAVSWQAMAHLTRALRLAGFRMVGESPTTVFTAISVQNAVDLNGSDRIVVRYYGAGTGADGDGTIFDCLGQGLNATTMTTGMYAVLSNLNGLGLQCSVDNGATWTMLFPGVESLQVLLGLDNNNNLSINAMRPAAATMEDTSAAVRALYVSMVTRSTATSMMKTGTSTLTHFGASYVPGVSDAAATFTYADDGRARVHERALIALRNRLD